MATRKGKNWGKNQDISATGISAATSKAGMQAPGMRTTTRKKTQQIVDGFPSSGIADVSQTSGV
eukprot:scaffold2243_cov145-Skeletonema_menzelii.AAC.1